MSLNNNMTCDLVLVNINTNERFILDHNVHSYKCGRGKVNHVLTSSILASREHCMFLRANGGLNVLDLGSSNGIYINGEQQPSRVMAALKINDVIGLGCPNQLPEDNPSAKSPAIYKLLILETEPVADLSETPADTTAKITSNIKRRHSKDSLDGNGPRKIRKLETSIPDIIDISDDSNDDIIIPTSTDNKSSDKKIAVEPNVSPVTAKTCENDAFSKTKEVSHSLQENNSEFSFSAGTSTCLSTHKRIKSEDNDRNPNDALNIPSSTRLSTNGRKRSEDDKKNLNSSNVHGSSVCSPTNGRKRPEDTDKNPNGISPSNAAGISNGSSSNGRKMSVDNNKNENLSKVATTSSYFSKNDKIQSEDSDKNSHPSNAASTSTYFPTNERKKSVEVDKNSNVSKVTETSDFLSPDGRKKSVDGEKKLIPSKVAATLSNVSTNARKKSADSDKNTNPSKTAETPAILSTNGRKKSVESDKNSDLSRAAEVPAISSTNRRKRSEDSEKNLNPPNNTKISNSSRERKKSEDNDRNNCQKPPKVRKLDELQSAAPAKETNSREERAGKDRVTSEKKASNVPNKKGNSSEGSRKSSRLKDQIVPSSTDSRSSSDETRNAKNPQEAEKANECLKDDEDVDFLVPAFNLDEFNLQERLNCDNNRHGTKEPSIEIIKNSPIEQLVKYEPELNIIDDDESVYKNLNNSTKDNIAQTPIKLIRVKHEPKTRYSEFDVVVLSDDEDGVFPASQLFGDKSDDEIEHKVETEEELIEDIDGDIFENSRDDVPDTIDLFDSDDEDNPWYDRLLRSQLLNESRLSLSNSIKKEAEEENVPFDIPFGEDLEELFNDADEVKEKENMEVENVVEEAQQMEEEDIEEDEGLFSAQDFLATNDEKITIKDVKEEIFDLCFQSESNKTKKSGPEKSKRKDKKAKSTEKEKAIEEAVPKSSLEKQSSKDVETTAKIDKNEKTVVNKNRKEKTSVESERIEDKPVTVDKRISRKKRLSDHKISLDKQRLWAEKQANEEKIADKKSTAEKSTAAEKRSPEEKIVSSDKRLPEEKRISSEKRSTVEKSSLHKQKSVEKTPEVEKRTSIEKSSLPKQKSIEKAAEVEKIVTKDAKSKPKSNKHEMEKRRRSSEAKSSNMSDSSNDRPDFAEPKSKNTETLPENEIIPKVTPVVVLTKLDNVAKTVKLVDAPFLTNGEHRGVSCKVTTTDKSSDKQGTPVASTSGTNDQEKAARKLTTKEKKEVALKTKIEQKTQIKEQRHRLQKNKWAAKCLPPKKKPSLSPFTPKERKDINNDRKEKLKQIANEKKAAEELQPSTTRRVVRAKAKITTNTRNDFLVKELEEQAKPNAANLERLASEIEDKKLEGSKENDKSLELRMEEDFVNGKENDKSLELRMEEDFANGVISPALVEKSPGGKKGTKDTEEKIRQMNEDSLVKDKVKEKSPEAAKEIPVNGDIDLNLGTSVKTIPKKTKFLEESEVPNNFAEKSSNPNALKKTLMVNGMMHVFGEQSRRVGQTLTSNTNANVEESSRLVADPRIRIGKSGKSVLKENREPNAIKETGKTKTKKRVSFNDLNTRVEFFEIDPGNSLKKCVSKDAPLIVKQLPKCRNANSKACCPKLEQFLLNIFRWNPVWLEEQKQLNSAPPVVDERKLSPMLSKYTSYDDYYKTTEPLLALELWNGISRDYESKVNQKACLKYSIVNHSIALTTVPSTKVRVTTLMLEVVVSKKDAEIQAHPVYGDLVFFEYISNRKSKEGCQRWKVFAYVTNVRQTVIGHITHFNRDLLNFVKDPHILLTYTVMTKPLDASDIQTNKVSRLRTISYLRSNIRMIQALQNLPVSPLCSTILHPKVEDYQLPIVANLESYSLVTKDKLNPRQLEAVARITEAAVQRLPRVCLIQGPPGTGKSRVIVNLVTQILYGNGRYQSNKKLRILVCAPSNAAIDEIVLRLLDIRRTFQKGNRFNMVRIGRNESMHPQVKEVSVTELAGRDVKKTADTYMSPTFTSDSVEEEKRFLQARMNALQLEKSNTTAGQNELYQKQVLRKLGDIQAKYNLLMNRKPADRLDDREKGRLQRAAENTLLKGADVITCTLTSCYTNQMEAIFGGKDSISVCIVDEATQSSEAETLIPLMLGVRTLVLVGDTNQLPATVLSQKAKQFGLEQSLFARIQNAFDGQAKDPITLLNTQYRMSCPVAWWPNRFFYAGAIKNDPVMYPFPFHCYKIMDLDSTQNEDKFSNTDEASFVAKVVYTLMTRSKLDHLNVPVKIGVITPYNNQKQLVIQKIRERIANVSEKIKKKIVHEVNTVDSFQGQERDVIIMSCVRSNGIGFLSDRQRLCVALTRAKHSLILCGNFKTFRRDPMWNALLTDARDRGAYVTIKAKAETDEIKPHIVR